MVNGNRLCYFEPEDKKVEGKFSLFFFLYVGAHFSFLTLTKRGALNLFYVLFVETCAFVFFSFSLTIRVAQHFFFFVCIGKGAVFSVFFFKNEGANFRGVFSLLLGAPGSSFFR